jgi:hypothetical protein
MLLRIQIIPFMAAYVEISSGLAIEARFLPIVLINPYGSQPHIGALLVSIFVSARLVSIFSILTV